MADPIKIQLVNNLIDLATSIQYPIVETDKETNKQSLSSPIEYADSESCSVLFNEIRCSFIRSSDGTSLSTSRDPWVFQGRLKFNQEVLIDPFIDLITGSVLSEVLEDEQGNKAMYLLELSDHVVEHPCHNETNGTVAIFTINITQRR